ncbi:MAG: efflux RND transporter periplasmic adaptor subunit [Pseudomonadota bacterium]|jgi:membrane fusion protein (multidrug efflux system)
MSWARMAAYAGLAAILAVGVYFLRQSPAEDDNNGLAAGDAAPVVVASAQRVPFVDRLESLGTLRANESVTILAEVSGVVAQVHFNDGQQVATGATLVTLESQEEEAALAAAEADLTEKRKQFERLAELVARNAVSQAQLDVQTAALRKAEADVKTARARLAKRRVTAPFAGRLGLRRVSKGALVNPGLEITSLDDLSVLKLDFQIPEAFLPSLSPGQTIEARTTAYPGRLFNGKVATVDSRVDPVTRMVQVRALLPNPDSALRPGMSMTVELLKNPRRAIRVPEEALVAVEDKQFVYVVEDGVARLRPVAIGGRTAGYMEVLSGLAEDEKVVVQGMQRLRDGAPVQIVAPTVAPQPAEGGPA